MSNLFDYIEHDALSMQIQGILKEKVSEIELLFVLMSTTRESQIAYKSLEEFTMWMGKAIRADQISRENIKNMEDQNSTKVMEK